MIIAPPAKIVMLPPPTPYDPNLYSAAAPLPPPKMPGLNSCRCEKILRAVAPLSFPSPGVNWRPWAPPAFTVIVPAIVTVPLARILVPLPTVNVTPELTEKLVHWMPAVGGVVTQLVVLVIAQTPFVVESEPSP